MGLLAIYFTEIPNAEEALSRMEHFLEQAAPALGRALRAERKTVGMLHAIERLTNLYDLSKAFGSTIDIEELSHAHRPKGRGLRHGGDGVPLDARRTRT